VGRAKYDSDKYFFQAIIEMERWIEKREKEKKLPNLLSFF